MTYIYLIRKKILDDCTPVPKHVADNTCHELNFIECICWLIYLLNSGIQLCRLMKTTYRLGFKIVQ